MHDDATSRMQFGRFVKRDTGAENRRAIIACLKRHGRPLAVYADHAGHFGQRRKDGKRTKSVIARGLEALGVELILAGSPQAKGRIERTYGTAQDRLVKEMRVAGVATIEEANRFLEEHWIPFWNEHFTVAPRRSSGRAPPVAAGRRSRSPVRGRGCAGRGTRLHGALEERVLADPAGGGRGGRSPAGLADRRRAASLGRAAPAPRRPVLGGPGAGRRPACAARSGTCAAASEAEAVEAGTEPSVAPAYPRGGRARRRQAGAPPRRHGRVVRSGAVTRPAPGLPGLASKPRARTLLRGLHGGSGATHHHTKGGTFLLWPTPGHFYFGLTPTPRPAQAVRWRTFQKSALPAVK